MFIFAFSIFILSVRENTGDIQIMLDLLENAVILHQCRDGGNGKNCGVLSVSCLSFVILNNMVCN